MEHLFIEKGAFCLLAGASGSGKTTLLRQIFKDNALQGKQEGILSVTSDAVSYVWQNPASQIVTDRVEYEIVFGLENIGMKKEQMQRRLAEVVTFFGLEALLERDTMNLSGGEMQILNVAAAVAMNPDILLLDEPASQLDPVAARRLYEMLRQINEELGITVVIAEQRLEDIIVLADQMVLIREGKVVVSGTPGEVYQKACPKDRKRFFPSYMQVYKNERKEMTQLISQKTVRQWFEKHYQEKEEASITVSHEKMGETISCKSIHFRYEKNMADVVKDCNCNIPKGNVTCIAGGNGSGKSTFLQLLSGRYRSYHGKIKEVPTSISYLPQQAKYLFLEDSFEQARKNASEMTKKYITKFGIEELLHCHPADVSGGELQRMALCFVLGKDAELYLLDEPTKGMDRDSKEILKNILRNLVAQRKTVVMVSHDMEFAAQVADYMALMFKGRLDLLMDSRSFFEENQFYTTELNRIARGVSRHIITGEDVDRYAKKIRD